MPKPLKKKRAGLKSARPPHDVNQWARHLVEQTTAELAPEPEVTTPAPIPPAALSAYMAAIGRKGGKIGGKRRLETMTFEQRSDIALKAARARWAPKTKRENNAKDVTR